MKIKTFVISCLLFLTSLSANDKIITIGATPVPFGEVLEFAKPLFKQKGYELKIVEFSDYSIPNKSLLEGSLDANLFQHKPYLDEFNRANKTDLQAVLSVAIFPMGAYSRKFKDIKELKNGANVAVPNDPTNESRALELLEKANLIKLDEKVALKTPLDISSNPKKLNFKELKAAQVARALEDVDLAVINTNYALDFGLKPLKDSIILEDKNSPYANFLVVRKEDVNSVKTQVIKEILHSQKVKEFMLEKYEGNIIPTF
ncbi:MetQ/NlpA family ABC transporter substrate-binding protein [Campylobacter sp. MIT 97-5078]|uniref:MetQ/NlpA family ABC transporter substrate-binding protein n=1 Tax=Campylobacter sp. MIT 97-5078 TaxID=1548153 RepID=UPI000512E2F7|nr:MetQ/NlpA family ABC transporter substrate-binding protein [Campylobacter sp. MIT 97-5078]KGI57043.1 methionine ABC transporter substrate-binding protein [Campylobacter sp. MIT 97-5078]TQR28129.1 MetQ/NlpA family ABC transporter substrate-binding protein [Campylobacter sp. MIT 97-5078]